VSVDDTRLSVLLIEDDPDYAALVHKWIRQSPQGRNVVLNWTESLAAATQRTPQGDINLILLDLTLPDSEGLATYRAVKRVAPSTPVIVLSSADSESVALETIRLGAEDYLVKSACTPDVLMKAVFYAVLRHQHNTHSHSDESSRNRVVAVAGVKGGVGATTIACLLAAELRGISEGQVLLMDLEFEGGLVAFNMGIESRYSVLDVTSNLDRLEPEFWRGVTTEAGGVHVIPAPPFGAATGIEQNHVEHAVRASRTMYPWVVLDCGRLRPSNLKMLADMTDPMLVTTHSIASLHEAKRAVELVCQQGLDRDALRLVVNHTESNAEPLRDRELEKLFGAHVYAHVPYEGDEIRDALVRKALPPETTEIRQRLRTIACRLAGLEEPKPKRRVPEFLSLLTKSRRPAPADAVATTPRV
jgi:Flp pilus assembly CpaE family ATPase